MAPDAPVGPGSVIADAYDVRRRIGKGGMSQVFEAWQRDPGQAVAIKVIELGGEDARVLRRRFFNELLLATRVKHPNICAVYDFGVLEETGHPYLVMELLRGVSLKRHLRERGPMQSGRALMLFGGVLDALGEAHALGVIHKDLKPENLFLTDIGTASESLVVLDFGIAHRVRGANTPSEYTGTPRYLAPEYILKKVVGPSIDVYQVGLTLCEALTGQPVVESKDPEVAVRVHTSGQIRPPAMLRDGPLGELLTRALAFAPEDRFADGRAFAEAVVALSDLEPSIRHTQPPAPVRRGPPPRGTGAAVLGHMEEEDLAQTQLLDDGNDMDPTVLMAPLPVISETPPPAPPPAPAPLEPTREVQADWSIRSTMLIAALASVAAAALTYALLGG